MGFCGDCGAAIKPNKKFCTKCGAEISVSTRVLAPPPLSDLPKDAPPVEKKQERPSILNAMYAPHPPPPPVAVMNIDAPPPYVASAEGPRGGAK